MISALCKPFYHALNIIHSCSNTCQSLGSFLNGIHPSIPLFDRENLVQSINLGTVDTGVYTILIAIALRVLHCDPATSGGHNSEAYLDAELAALDNTPAGTFNLDTSLPDMQKACLLAYYGFHHRPGLRSWTRISLLTRKAYALGLSQLDATYVDDRPVPMTGIDSLDDWRRVWWIIYCLDSYSSITAGTPFIVEQASVVTAIKCVKAGSISGIGGVTKPVFLATEIEEAWITASELAKEPDLDHFAIHLVATILLKEAGTLFRLEKQRPSKTSKARAAKLEDHIAAVRLALPSGYFAPTRMALRNESILSLHSRMVNAMLIAKASILRTLATMMDERTESILAEGWQQGRFRERRTKA
jgi:hypothetical protein